MPVHLPIFVVTTWLLAMLPGAGQALILRQTLDGGRHRAWASIAGTCTGLLIWTAAAAAGLSAVLLASPHAYTTVRIAGGVFLVVLGGNTLLSVRRGATGADAGTATTARHRRAFLTGLATNLGNPKAGVFAISLLPQFLTADGPVFASSIALGALWAFVTGTWYLLFTWAVDHGRALVSKPTIHRRLQLLTGCVLLCIGTAVAVGA